MSIHVKCVGRYSAFIPISICGAPPGFSTDTDMLENDLKYLIFDTSHFSAAQGEVGKRIKESLSATSPKNVLITRKANVVGDKDCIHQSIITNCVALPSNWIVRRAGTCPSRIYGDWGKMFPSTLIEGKDYYDILIPLAEDSTKTYTLAKNVIGIIGFDFSKDRESLTIDGLGRGWNDAETAPFSITFSHRGGTLCIGFSSEQMVEDYDYESDTSSYHTAGMYTRKMYMYLNPKTYSLRNNTLRGSLLSGESPALIIPISMHDSFSGFTVNEYGEPDGSRAEISEETIYSHATNFKHNGYYKRSVEECNFFSRVTDSSPLGFMEGDVVQFLPEIPFRQYDVDGNYVGQYEDPDNWRSIIRLPQFFATPATLCPSGLAQDMYDVDSMLLEYHAGRSDEAESSPGTTVSDLFSDYWNHPDSDNAKIIHDTVVKALENLKYTDVNTPAFLLEDVVDLAKMAYTIGSYVRQPGKAVKNVKRLKSFLSRKGKKLSKAQKVLKKTADGYLNYRFGLPMTISDIKEMVRDYHRHSRRSAKTWGSQKFFSGRARATLTSQRFPNTKFCCKIYVRQYDDNWKKLLQYLYRANLYLSAENTWDLIPFSFVVDWIIPVNKLMKYIDINTYDRALPVVSVLYSLKCVKPTDGVDFKASHLSSVTSIRYYIRWSEGQLPEILQSVPSLSLNVDKNLMLHTIDATALAIQHSMSPRLKR